MKKNYMPDEARMIIDTLYENGYEAYIVGGCVRDALLGRRADDYDITTNAHPEDVKRIFEKTVDTGIKHGTVTVICKGKPYEVTTYRIDGEYLDMRHPASVSFTGRLEDDLARRDFTVNAVAYNDRAGIVDAFGGLADIENRVIRAVGCAEVRFSEDALRVLRGIRFAATLGFSIEEKTDAAIRKLAPNLRGVSAERIFVELKKLLGGSDAYKIIRDFADVINVFLPEADGALISERNFMKLPSNLRLLALFTRASDFTSASARLRMDNKTRDDGVAILSSLDMPYDGSETELRLYLVDKDDGIATAACELAEARGLCKVGTLGKIRRLIDGGCVHLISQLAVSGKDMIALGMKGERIGRALSALVRAVAIGDVENEKKALIKYASEKL